MFIYSLITSQHLLNKPLTKREIHKRVSVVSQLLFWLVEILLRMYIVYCQCIYTHIQQFNRKMIVLQGFKLLPCDCVEASHSPYRLIPTLPIAVELVGGIKSVRLAQGSVSNIPATLFGLGVSPPLPVSVPAKEECRCNRKRMYPCRHCP